jgi:hypothetical protein
LPVPTPCLGNLRDRGSAHAMRGDTAACQKATRSSRAAWEAGMQTQRKLTPCGRGTCHRGWCREGSASPGAPVRSDMRGQVYPSSVCQPPARRLVCRNRLAAC